MPLTVPAHIADFDTALALGLVRNTNGNAYIPFPVHGSNPNVGTSAELISDTSAAPVFRDTQRFYNVAAGGNAVDGVGQIGAREVELTGIDTDGHLLSTTIKTAGVSQSSFTNVRFWRLFDARVTLNGLYGAFNLGDINIADEDGNDHLRITSRFSKAHHGQFAVPVDYTCLIRGLTFTIGIGDVVSCELYKRERLNGTTVGIDTGSLENLKAYQELPSGVHYFDLRGAPVVIAEWSDVWCNAKVIAGGVATAVAVDIDAILVPNK
tara:strand:+ start:17952 stop:18749 length:798 start_codon:yes stop_codon:yes gene_type:complete